jgi:DNA-binding transcriptional LysR family regulator
MEPPHDFDDLAAHRFIGFDRELAYVREMLKSIPDFPDTRFAFRSDSNVAQLAMIRAGAGIGMSQVGIAARDPDLVELLPGQLKLELETYLVMHENLKTVPRCRVAFDALAEGLLAYRAACLKVTR